MTAAVGRCLSAGQRRAERHGCVEQIRLPRARSARVLAYVSLDSFDVDINVLKCYQCLSNKSEMSQSLCLSWIVVSEDALFSRRLTVCRQALHVCAQCQPG